jgi:hypothetical protein
MAVFEKHELLALTPEENAEFRRIGNTPIGDITPAEHQRYHEIVKKVFDWLEKKCDEPEEL